MGNLLGEAERTARRSAFANSDSPFGIGYFDRTGRSRTQSARQSAHPVQNAARLMNPTPPSVILSAAKDPRYRASYPPPWILARLRMTLRLLGPTFSRFSVFKIPLPRLGRLARTRFV